MEMAATSDNPVINCEITKLKCVSMMSFDHSDIANLRSEMIG